MIAISEDQSKTFFLKSPKIKRVWNQFNCPNFTYHSLFRENVFYCSKFSAVHLYCHRKLFPASATFHFRWSVAIFDDPYSVFAFFLNLDLAELRPKSSKILTCPPPCCNKRHPRKLGREWWSFLRQLHQDNRRATWNYSAAQSSGSLMSWTVELSANPHQNILTLHSLR